MHKDPFARDDQILFPFSVTEPPQASENCPRANGYFPHSQPGKCNEFYYCSGGTGNHLNCPESLVFSLKTGTCVWPDEAGRTDDCKGSRKKML